MPPPPGSSPAPGALLTPEQAADLAGLFEVLASATRLRLLQALTALADPCMSDLAAAVAMKPQAVSNQLRKLVERDILDTRRHGNHIHYRIIDPCVSGLLEHGLDLCRAQSSRKLAAP
jgi:DNA-binding transcriptional ArsR family regulator